MSNSVIETNKVSHDYSSELRDLWLADGTRNWLVYSKEKFRQFWTIRQTEVHSKK